MPPRKIIIDTDPGQDDALALMLACASPDELEIIGVIAVAGNVPLHHTLNNARKVLELAGRPDVPLYAGSDAPMQRILQTAEHVHGVTGLDGPDLPAPLMPVQPKPGVQFLIDTLRKSEHGSITLVALGPLTDLGHAFQQAPDILPKIAEVVMMFGAWREMGNVTPTAEFNAYVDPHAADIVLKSGVKITILPLDATHKIISTQARIQVLKAMPNRSGPNAAIMLKASEAFDIAKFGGDGAPLHDPCTIAYLLKPELFSGRTVNVAIETRSELTMGMTVVDWWKATPRAPNALFMTEANADGFYQLLFERIARLP
ncbi:MAG: nucleoside hydrolase [Asticcacaulis sp.]